MRTRKVFRNQLLQVIIVAMVVLFISSCAGGDRGNLIGVQDRQIWYQPDPFGMVFIPQGSFTMGQSDQDVPYSHIAQSKTVTVTSFYMDETEITNNEYRQFVYWVRDSIARRKLGEVNEEFLITENAYGETYDPPFINWNRKFRWDGEEEREALADMYITEQERFYRRKEFDVRKFNYEYWWIDYRQAAKKNMKDPLTDDQEIQKHAPTNTDPASWRNRRQAWNDRSVFIRREIINVYPDTLCWIHDYTYSYNEPMMLNYFSHPAYDNYPVVGVNWRQARAFSIWRTNYMNNYLEFKVGSFRVNEFRLPTETEWEWAARGGLDLNPYPWGGPYARNYNGCFLANYKPLRGNYQDDGGVYPLIVAHYAPNDYGLYDMAGNVAEWCRDAYEVSMYNYAHDMNQSYEYEAKESDHPTLKRKVVRGGSWKDIGYLIQVSTRTYEYQDTGKSYIGFRNVQSYMGRMKGDGPNASNVY